MNHLSLVICEKPHAARRIAQALGTNNFKRSISSEGIPFFYAVSNNNNHFIIFSSIGHIYGLVDVTKNREIYPVFDLEWMPLVAKSGRLVRVEQIIKSISEASKGVTRFIHACDYDQEGEVIGYNILQYACKFKYNESLRAKFSTLTDQEIRESFDNLLKPSTGLAEAGRCRHILDFIYGVNLSRALSQLFKVGNNGKQYHNLSIGRVQGPTLAFVVQKEIDIRKHIPDPYWSILADFEKNGHIIKTFYEKEKVMTLSEANSIINACNGKDGLVSQIKVQKMLLRPPTPFNLGDLQREAYRLFKLSPSYTLSIAESLYLNALISYPRTSSQKLPLSIDYKKIIARLSLTNSNYESLATILLSKDRLIPNEGIKTDPAHPAIYPTGEKPKQQLDRIHFKIYDLIIRRFFASFGNPAINQRTIASININGRYNFKSEGKSNIYEGWIHFYKPYFIFHEVELPSLNQGDVLKNILVISKEKFMQPPLRFNQASLLEQMEKEQIGTKTTRAEIISTLFKRNYITPSQNFVGIEVTDLGFAVIEIMKKYFPDIVSTDFTRSIENDLEKIEICKSKTFLSIEYAVDTLIEWLTRFKEKEITLGHRIVDRSDIILKEMIAGTCPLCQTGELRVIISRTSKKKFVGCSNYSAGCKATAPLPQKGSIKTTTKKCNLCNWPIINITFSSNVRQPREICINTLCPSKNRQGVN
ncbi:MAG: DNA topoisomerase I [Thermoproteota archaeon]|nr:DNA topoisomerase I [Thermoproteota archaeon]